MVSVFYALIDGFVSSLNKKARYRELRFTASDLIFLQVSIEKPV